MYERSLGQFLNLSSEIRSFKTNTGLFVFEIIISWSLACVQNKVFDMYSVYSMKVSAAMVKWLGMYFIIPLQALAGSTTLYLFILRRIKPASAFFCLAGLAFCAVSLDCPVQLNCIEGLTINFPNELANLEGNLVGQRFAVPFCCVCVASCPASLLSAFGVGSSREGRTTNWILIQRASIA